MNRSVSSNDDDGSSNYRYHQKQNNGDNNDNNHNTSTGTQTDDLLDLFSTTMYSLAADAAAIRQITDLAELTGITSLSDNKNKNKNGNHNTNNEEVENEKREHVQELCDLDRLISGVEQKVIALRQIINEENSALTKFETNLRDEADEQATIIEDLMSALDLQQQHKNNTLSSSSSNDRDDDNRWHSRYQKISEDEDDNDNDNEWRYGRHDNSDRDQHQYQHHDETHIQPSKGSSNSNSNNNRRGVLQSRTMGKMGNQSSPHPSRGVNGSRISNNNNNNNRNDSYKPSSSSPNKKMKGYSQHEQERYGDDNDEEQEEEQQEEDPYFVKVTKSEILEQTPSFGVHLSRFDLNEALEEIEHVVWNKISLEPKSSIHSSGSSPPPSHLSSNTLQRRFDYLRQRQRGSNNTGSDNETEAHVGHRWVSEQELRENCAFFRNGESTARATLQLLCSLKRLKQVPGKNREVTYLCLFR
jgi:hypothetical protein